MSFVGNATNSIVVAKDSIELKSPLTESVKKAQDILKHIETKNKEEIADLAKNLYNGVVEMHLTGGWFLRKATNVVIDWDENIDRGSFANISKVMRGYEMTSKLLGWQKELLSRLKKEKEVKKVYIFNDRIIDNFWVIVDEPSTDIILKYSDIYMKFLTENIDIVCEFMVFNQDEIENYNFPKQTTTVNCEDKLWL